LFAAVSALIALAIIGLGYVVWRLEARCRELSHRLWRLAVLTRDAELRRLQSERLEHWQRQTERAVDLTAVAVRELHRGVAQVPLSLLRRSHPDPAKVARVARLHDQTAEAVYDGIRAVNRLLGEGLRKRLKSREGTAPPGKPG
jgi:hypothetical protein